MVCERCYRLSEVGEHGVGLCPLQPRRAPVVRPDSIPGGVQLAHGLCNPDGSPRRFDSQSEISRACREKGLIRWTDVYTEDRTKDARVHDDWLKSGEAMRQRAERVEKRRQKAEARR